jgi:hypothetical protein
MVFRLQPAVWCSGFSLPYGVQASACRMVFRLICRASCKEGGTMPLICYQWVTGCLPAGKNTVAGLHKCRLAVTFDNGAWA